MLYQYYNILGAIFVKRWVASEGGGCYWGNGAGKMGGACHVGAMLLLQFISHHTSSAETMQGCWLCRKHRKLISRYKADAATKLW